MAFTYSGNPEASSKDTVRFYVQDTVAKAPLLQDAEIQFAITVEAGAEPDSRGLLAAAALCCETLAVRYAAQPDTLIGSLQVTGSKAAAVFSERAVELRGRAQGSGLPFVGGQSRSEKQALREDPDRVQPRFRRDQFRVPWRRRAGEDIYPGEI